MTSINNGDAGPAIFLVSKSSNGTIPQASRPSTGGHVVIGLHLVLEGMEERLRHEAVRDAELELVFALQERGQIGLRLEHKCYWT
ncbi:hypothetical protein [Variovorax sp. E3]|uniref:hypothetical protein n=1 Tax=Variovorax sp. E3 TaxID=1914993 RepID=UPI0018DBA60F|nr:hypothetical protein [Variovorax sp. E3]